MQIGAGDAQILRKYHQFLTQGAAAFAQEYYNYLFDIPDAADVLYTYERNGGNIGDLVRAQLHQLLHALDAEDDYDADSVTSQPFAVGLKPVWVMGAYRLYLDHLQRLVNGLPEIAPEDRPALANALVKRIFLDLGLTLQAQWDDTRVALESACDTSRSAHARVETVFDSLSLMLWSYDVRAHELLYASPALHALCQPDSQDPIPCFERLHADDREKASVAWQLALDGAPTEVRVRLHLNGGAERWCSLRLQPARSGHRRVQRIDGLFADITEAHNAFGVLEHQATVDALTGLANRTLWSDRAHQALSHCRREEGLEVVLMLLDLDQLKSINDDLGRPVGDEILCQVARRLGEALRDSDTLARIGGDEFAILMPAVACGELAGERVAAKLVSCFEHPFDAAGGELFLNIAVGIALYPQHGDSVDELLNHADIALHRAKRSDGRYSFYVAEGQAGDVRQLRFSGQLRQALDRDEFELHYQPKLGMRDREVCGVEALLRWRHPQQGLMEPAMFLPLAEQIGLMSPITSWVLVTALRQCRAWGDDGICMPVSVNVSARAFQNPRLLERVEWALEQAGVDGECLEIEITEDTLMADTVRGAEFLSRLHALGVTVAMDDFGTGYSSLAYLRRLPINTLKIDKSFLADGADHGNDATIIRSIIDLGHNLGFRVLAEGVEDAQAWEMLTELGCDAVQGYHISRPLSDTQFTEWLQTAAYRN
ncbi:MAG: putative bifunctional diguanylate cyclase/phosphodiesterase [Gammaproteobacteria bacterium]